MKEIGLEAQVDSPPVEVPEDAFTATKKKADAAKEATSAVRQPDRLRKFLDNDRRVLRFFCYWDDATSSSGDVRLFVRAKLSPSRV